MVPAAQRWVRSLTFQMAGLSFQEDILAKEDLENSCLDRLN
jgi:hypothetical protein